MPARSCMRSRRPGCDERPIPGASNEISCRRSRGRTSGSHASMLRRFHLSATGTHQTLGLTRASGCRSWPRTSNPGHESGWLWAFSCIPRRRWDTNQSTGRNVTVPSVRGAVPAHAALRALASPGAEDQLRLAVRRVPAVILYGPNQGGSRHDLRLSGSPSEARRLRSVSSRMGTRLAAALACWYDADLDCS